MNLILFETKDTPKVLESKDPRTIHIRKVLKMGVGDELFVGVINGPRGKAVIERDDENGMALRIKWDSVKQEKLPIVLVVGLPRPQTARRILEDATTMGVEVIYFYKAEKGEASYASSKLWETGLWKQYLIKGAEQAFSTTIPEVVHFENLEECLKELEKEGKRLALDNYEGTRGLSDELGKAQRYILAIGAERGLSTKERDLLRSENFILTHLGERVLRAETACVAGLAIISSQLEKR